MKGRARKGSALLRLDLVQRRGSIFCQKSSQPREAEETSDQRHQIANLAYWVTGTEGSNPSLSANESQVSGILRRRSQNARVYERCARPIGTGERGDGEPCRVTLIFSLWASNSVPMPAIGDATSGQQPPISRANATGTSSFRREKAFRPSIAF